MEISRGTAQDIAKASAAPNPANPPTRRVTEATRVPMTLPELKLAVPELPGYYLYWHLGKNVMRAKAAGYDFVDPDEVMLNQHGIANDRELDGNTDLGTRVSVAAGADDPDRLYLMKLPLEWHEKDMDALTARNEQIAVQLRAGTIGAEGDPDRNKRYMKEGQHLFYPKVRR